MPFHIGPMEIGIIVVLVLMIFGVGRLPQVGGAIGKSIREFRKARAGEAEEDKSKDKVAPSQAKRKPKTRANSRRPKSTLL